MVYPILNKDILKKYSIHYEDKNSALLLFNPTSNGVMDENDYSKYLTGLVDRLQDNGITVYTKGHPRMGLNTILEKKCDVVIQDFIPSEFIDMSSFRFIIGLWSTSIANASKMYPGRVFSMLKCFPCKDYKLAQDYLKKQSNDTLLFPEKIDTIFK